MNFEELWNKVLEIIKEDTNQVSFNTWFRPLKIVAYKDDTIYLETADDFLRNTLKKRYYNFLKNAFNYVFNIYSNICSNISTYFNICCKSKSYTIL